MCISNLPADINWSYWPSLTNIMSKIYVDLLAFECFVLIILYLSWASQQLSAYSAEDFATQSGACGRKTSFIYKQKLCNHYQSTLCTILIRTGIKVTGKLAFLPCFISLESFPGLDNKWFNSGKVIFFCS